MCNVCFNPSTLNIYLCEPCLNFFATFKPWSGIIELDTFEFQKNTDYGCYHCRKKNGSFIRNGDYKISFCEKCYDCVVQHWAKVYAKYLDNVEDSVSDKYEI